MLIEHQGELVARHVLVAPGEVSILDEHYGGPRRGPTRAARPRSGTERAFLALGCGRALPSRRGSRGCDQARHRARPHHLLRGGLRR